MKKVALLVGVSEYVSGFNPLPAAVKDVAALKRVLENPDIGGFHEIKALINPEPQIMREEIEILFDNRKKDDLVLLFFSGHGVKDDRGKLYFATRSTRKNERNELIKATAVPASYVHEAMNNSRTRRQVIILDCCFSGAFDPTLLARDDGFIDLENQLGAEGRVVLTSSSSTQYAFEQQGEELSIYSRYLVEGIETGNADADADGSISIRELHDYVENKVREVLPSMNPKIIVMKEMGYEIKIAKSQVVSVGETPKESENVIDFGEISLSSSKSLGDNERINSDFPALHNLLEPYESLISDLINGIANVFLPNAGTTSDLEVEVKILNSIQYSSKADFAFVLKKNKQDRWIIRAQSKFAEGIDYISYFESIKAKVLSLISEEEIFNPIHHGVYKIYREDGKNLSKVSVIIPLQMAPQAEFLVVCGLPQDSYLLREPYGKILSTFHQISRKIRGPASVIEAEILDELKRTYGFLPLSLYKRRFTLFYERLKKMVVYFEPIYCFSKRSIDGWEALARDPEKLHVPSDLFKTVELWGDQFTIELDKHFLEVAVESYIAARERAGMRRGNDIASLSVNVYPASLVRRAYREKALEIMAQNDFLKRYLILEISEKSELLGGEDGSVSLDKIRKELQKYVNKGIRFAIDDFGVGYGSVSRLAKLELPYVKIDREILHHKQSEIIVRFVYDLVHADNQSPPNVILEGFDDSVSISMARFKEIGIDYVQGHIVGVASPDVYRLSKEKFDFLQGLIRQELIDDE